MDGPFLHDLNLTLEMICAIIRYKKKEVVNMEFKEVTYLNISLTDEEKSIIDMAHDILYDILARMRDDSSCLIEDFTFYHKQIDEAHDLLSHVCDNTTITITNPF